MKHWIREEDKFNLKKPLYEKHVFTSRDMFGLMLGEHDLGLWVVHYLREQNEADINTEMEFEDYPA